MSCPLLLREKSQKLVKESKSEVVNTKPVHGLAVDLPTNYATSNPPGVPLHHKSTSKTKDKNTKQPADPSKDNIKPGSTLDDDIKWCITQLEMAIVSKCYKETKRGKY